MTDDSKATPRPWCYENIGEKENLYAVGIAWRKDDPNMKQIGGRVSSYDEKGNEILERTAICFIEEHSEGSIHADAALIVTAVNAYDALVAERDRLRQQVEDLEADASNDHRKYLALKYDYDLLHKLLLRRFAKARVAKTGAGHSEHGIAWPGS